MPYARVNGIDLYYESHGEGSPVVFLHGAGGNHLSWWQQVPAFRDRYRCITIDHRGFGRSLDPEGHGQAEFVRDLAGLLDELEIDAASIVAQSMGGRTAIGFTVDHPQRVDALVMADTWGFFEWPELAEEVRALRDRAQAADLPLVQRALGQAFQEREPARTFLYRQIAELNPPRDAQPGQTSDYEREAVARISVPVLFIVGGDDPLTPPAIIRRVHDLIAGSEYREFSGLGHSVYFEDPAAFNEAVGEFLGRYAGRTGS